MNLNPRSERSWGLLDMKSNWIKKPLSKVVMFKNGKKRPKDFGNIPVYGGNGILGYADNSNYENCIIIGRVGAYCGSVCYENNKCWVSDNAIAAQPIGENNIIFIYYLLKNLQLNNRHIGTSQPLLTQEILNRIECAIPPVEEQNRIASIINLIDEKIQNNIQINDNLLQQASTIYKAWFEDFSPFDGICPAGWKQGTLSDIADITSGRRPPMKSAEKTDIAIIPLVGAASVMGFTSESNHTDKILVTGRVGTHGVVQRFNTPCWTSDNTLVITSDFYEYTYQILQQIDYHALNRGSTQPLITQGDMNKVAIIIPDRQTLDNFETLVGQLMLQYEANLLENTKLADLRDALLPRLMSGELDVSDIAL